MHEYVYLYCIVDKISGMHVSNPIPAMNDGVALNGFIQFLKGEEEKGLARGMYRLLRIGEFHQNGVITSDGISIRVADGDNAEVAFKEWCEVELAKERMED